MGPCGRRVGRAGGTAAAPTPHGVCQAAGPHALATRRLWEPGRGEACGEGGALEPGRGVAVCENGSVGVSWASLPATQTVLEGSRSVLAVCLACKVRPWGRCGVGGPTPSSLGHSPDSASLDSEFWFYVLGLRGNLLCGPQPPDLDLCGGHEGARKGAPGQEERSAHQPSPLSAAAQVSPWKACRPPVCPARPGPLPFLLRGSRDPQLEISFSNWGDRCPACFGPSAVHHCAQRRATPSCASPAGQPAGPSPS